MKEYQYPVIPTVKPKGVKPEDWGPDAPPRFDDRKN